MKLLKRIRHFLGVAPDVVAGNWWTVGFAATALTLATGVVSPVSRADTPTAKSTVKVLVTKPRTKDVAIAEQYAARIRAIRHIRIRSLLQGQLQKISVAAEQEVKQGDVMFNIDPEPYRVKLNRARDQATMAERALDDAKKLRDDKAVSADGLALLEEKLVKAQADLQLAKVELTFTALKAPFEGTILSVDQKAGNQVKEGEELGVLADHSQMWVYFTVPETRYLEYPKKLDKLTIDLILANDGKFEQVGHIGAIEANVKDEAGNIPFRADFPNPDRSLRHGMSGTVVVNRIIQGAVVIPQRATFEKLNKRYVYVVDKDNVAHQREIVVHDESDDLYVVKSGVGVDDRIILIGIRQVRDGDKVECEEL
ncbi:MAG TPA: efflux RND transporter periplasmic adaptor subunit [Pirellulales bacterium]|nr:efflux RND transporter periplasmic adaptor subunit [Pirellulales bacterium]